MLKTNRTVNIEETLGTGLATLLAKDLGLTDVDLPDKPHRLKTESTALLKLRECFGKGRISVTPKRDGTMQVKVPGGFVILKP
jgi:hypothetical protein